MTDETDYTEYDLGRVVGDTGSTLWYTSTAPTYANSKYTFTISNLSGRSGLSVSVNDVIFYSTYYYIVSTVGSTTVDCETRVSIKGSDASVTIQTSWGSTTSDSKVPSEKLTKTELDKKIAKSSTSGLMKNDGTVDTNAYITSSSLPSPSSAEPKIDGYNSGVVGTSTDYARADHQHSQLFVGATGGTSDVKYVNILKIAVSESGRNSPITMAISKKGGNAPTYISIQLSNTDISQEDYTIDNFSIWGNKSSYYLRQSASNEFVLIAYKGANNTLLVTDVHSGQSGVTITPLDTVYGTSAPSNTSANPVWTATYTASGTEIVDNLTTNDSSKVLSAKQGKALADMIGQAISYINQ